MVIFQLDEIAPTVSVHKDVVNHIGEYNTRNRTPSASIFLARCLKGQINTPRVSSTWWWGVTRCQSQRGASLCCQFLAKTKLNKINHCQAWRRKWKEWKWREKTNLFLKKMRPWMRVMRKMRAMPSQCAQLGIEWSKRRRIWRPTYNRICGAGQISSCHVKTWALERDVITTMTRGSSFKANGGVEGEMNVIKKSIRTLISANVGTLTKQGPLAARHIGQWGNSYVLGQRCENPGKPGTCPGEILVRRPRFLDLTSIHPSRILGILRRVQGNGPSVLHRQRGDSRSAAASP